MFMREPPVRDPGQVCAGGALGAARPGKAAKSGFVPRGMWVHRAYNLALSLILFAVISPLFAALVLAVFATQGRRVFYTGPRIGIDGRSFNIIKFRTLDGERAKTLTRNGVLPEGSGLETPLGVFLRETRLDELPQILNVVRGDMNLCGPRPVRKEIAQVCVRDIPSYSVRFTVKPGLIGHTQAYMGHGTSKRIRARYNALLCRHPVRYRYELAMIFTVGACVLARTLSKSCKAAADLLGLRIDPDEKRAKRFGLELEFEDGRRCFLAAANDRYIRLRGPVGNVGAAPRGWLLIRLPDGARRRAELVLHRAAADPTRFAIAPASDFSDHIISRYLMMKVVVPHGSVFLPRQAGRMMLRGLRAVVGWRGGAKEIDGQAAPQKI